MMPCVAYKSILNYIWVLRPKTGKAMCRWFWGPKHQTQLDICICYASSTISTRVSICPRLLDHQAFVPSLDLVDHYLDLVNVVHSSICTLAYWCTYVSATYPAFRPSVPRSKSLVCPSPLLVHQHDMTLFDLLYYHLLSLCSTPVYHNLRDMFQKHHTHAKVTLQTQPRLDHLLIITDLQ